MDFETILPKLYLFGAIFFAACLLVIAAIMLDLWDGIYTARRTGQRVHSHRLRVTIAKIGEYFRLIAVGTLVDCLGSLFSFYPLPIITILFGAGLIIVELKSMLEHARRRKSHTAEMPEIIAQIIDCKHEPDAEQLVKKLSALLTTPEKDRTTSRK